MTRRLLLLVLLGCLSLGFLSLGGGCSRKAAKSKDAGAPIVTVARPIQRNVVDHYNYTGRIEAVNAVDIRARVTGYLVKEPFKEGSEVKKGELLFEIDPRPYQAQLDQAESIVNLDEAQLRLAQANYARAKVIAKTPGAISQQDIDTYAAAVDEAKAQLEAAKANVEQYQINREFCEIASPIDGRVSRYYYTLGNLINQDQTLLTTVVSLDPMYCYFDVDELTLLSIRRMISSGRLKAANNPEEIKVLLGLQGEDGYPHEGHVNFINNIVDPFTGTITLRGVFENPLISKTTRMLTPGMFARVQIPLGEPHPALLINDRAVGTDQGLKYVYVVDDDDMVEYRRVTLGPLEEDGMRVVQDGLKAEDWVVVSGLQLVRAKMKVAPERIDMPLPSADAAAAGAAAANKPAKEESGGGKEE